MAKQNASDGPKRAVLCARVSSAGQAEHGYGLKYQISDMRKYAAQNGFAIADEITDSITGATPIHERPGGAKLFKLIDNRAVDVVIFWKLDRATRDDDVIEIHVLRAALKKAGIELHYAADGGKSDLSAMGGIIDHIKAAAAAEEKHKIYERTREGLKSKAKAGKWTGLPPEPYGYLRIGKKTEVQLIINQAEAHTLRRIFYMYTGRNGHPYTSCRTICDVLNAEGVLPPSHKRDRTENDPIRSGPKDGKMWYPATVRMLLQNKAYIGKFTCMGVEIDLPNLALIDRETFTQAQAQFTTNAALASRNRKREYLLAGHLTCSCGRAMTGSAKVLPKRVTCYYECSSKHNMPGGVRKQYCAEGSIRADQVEQPVWDWLYGLIGDTDALRAGLKRLRERNEEMLAPKRERLETVDDLMVTATRQFRRLTAQFGNFVEDDDPALLALQADANRVAKQLAALKREREQLEADLSAKAMTEEEENQFLVDMARLKAGLTHPTYEIKRYVFQRMGLGCTLRRDAQGLRWLDVECTLTGARDSVVIANRALTATSTTR